MLPHKYTIKLRGEYDYTPEEQKQIIEKFTRYYQLKEEEAREAFTQELTQDIEHCIRGILGIQRPMVLLNHPAIALWIALQLAGISRVDEVILPTLSKISTMIALLGGRVRYTFVDGDSESSNMSAAALESLLQERTTRGETLPKALLLVHNYGVPADVVALRNIATQYGLIILEDASEALGASTSLGHCGTWGTYSIVGIGASSGEWQDAGVALLCPNETKALRARELAQRAFRHEEFEVRHGYEYGSLLEGVTLLHSWQRTVGWGRVHAKAISNQKLLQSLLAPAMGLSFWHTQEETQQQNIETEKYMSNGFYTPMLVDKQLLRFSSRELIERLRERGVEAYPCRIPLHEHPLFKEAPCITTGIAHRQYTDGVLLPTGAHISSKQIEEMALWIRDTILHYN